MTARRVSAMDVYRCMVPVAQSGLRRFGTGLPA